MKRVLITIGCALAAVWIAGCGEKKKRGGEEGAAAKKEKSAAEAAPGKEADTTESVAEELLVAVREYHNAVRSPSDVPTAKMAATKITQIAEKMKEISERLVKLEIPPEGVRKELGRRLREAERKINEEQGDVEDVVENMEEEPRRIMEAAVGNFGAEMQKLLVVFGEYFEVRGDD